MVAKQVRIKMQVVVSSYSVKPTVCSGLLAQCTLFLLDVKSGAFIEASKFSPVLIKELL